MVEQRPNKEDIFDDKEIESFVGLYETLKNIHTRLIDEGYIISDGQILRPEGTLHSK